MPLSVRFGPVRPFIGMRDYDDSSSTLQIGVTTYTPTDDGDEKYQTSYLEWGGRLDHLEDVIDQAMGREVTERRVSLATESERRYVASDERNGITAAKLKTVDVEATAA